MQEELFSKATKRNWERLNSTNKESKLTSRANKRLSTKKIMPVEYFKNPENRNLLKLFVYNNIKNTLYTTAVNLLCTNKQITINGNEITSDNEHILKILKDYKAQLIPELLSIKLPKDERDILGIIYQTHLSEGSKNKTGSYYTPQNILDDIFNSINPNDKILDPCCGTGSFLLAASDKIKDPQNIYGCDIDTNACFIAKINLILKFKSKKFTPNIYNIDFLLDDFTNQKFDVIATNPPWGAVSNKIWLKKFPQIKSGESFSYFISNSTNYLTENGRLFFVLPESVMNVKAHEDIRQFILENFHIEKIKVHGRAFSSVLSGVVTLHLSTDQINQNILIENKDKKLTIKQDFYKNNIRHNFSILDNKDIKILDKIYSIPHKKLNSQSHWALGIVTGNNAKQIFKTSTVGEKIYFGKNIKKNEITDSDSYIIYDRSKFQQAASDEIYRAKEKLVYKFISKTLTFAYDNKQRLFLNSANILIPKLEGYDIKTIMTFLNSTLFQYIYNKRFNEIKVLKGNLMELPFPDYDKKQYPKITDDAIFEIFGLSNENIQYIKSQI